MLDNVYEFSVNIYSSGNFLSILIMITLLLVLAFYLLSEKLDEGEMKNIISILNLFLVASFLLFTFFADLSDFANAYYVVFTNYINNSANFTLTDTVAEYIASSLNFINVILIGFFLFIFIDIAFIKRHVKTEEEIYDFKDMG